MRFRSLLDFLIRKSIFTWQTANGSALPYGTLANAFHVHNLVIFSRILDSTFLLLLLLP